MVRNSTLAVLLLLVFAGCYNPPPPVPENPWPPKWFTEPPMDPNFIVATTMGESKSAQTAFEMAEEAANHSIAATLELRVTGLTKRFIENLNAEEAKQYTDMFTRVGNQVVSNVLYGAMTERKMVRPNTAYEVAVLKTMPIGSMQKEFMNAVKENTMLQARFQQSQAMKELDEEVKKFEEWKVKRNGDLRIFTGQPK